MDVCWTGYRPAQCSLHVLEGVELVAYPLKGWTGIEGWGIAGAWVGRGCARRASS